MKNKTDNELTFMSGAHLVENGSSQTEPEEQDTNEPTGETKEPPLTITKHTAGVDEPEPSMRPKDELNSWGGPEPTSEEDDAPNANPGVDASENPLPEEIEWFMPGNSDSDTDGRTGLLSTRIEVHALLVGAAAGAMAAQGDINAIAAIVGAGALGSRLQIGLPDKYLQQAKQELPYAIAGIVIGYSIVRFGPQLAALGGA